MAGLARHLSAALVAIAMIAAQIMPAWAGCHSQRHVATTAVVAAQSEAASMPDHHGMMNNDTVADISVASDKSQPSPKDVCLGNCGCACGMSAAFVLTGVMAIHVPYGVVQTPEMTSIDLAAGDAPDGPRRPPRLTA